MRVWNPTASPAAGQLAARQRPLVSVRALLRRGGRRARGGLRRQGARGRRPQGRRVGPRDAGRQGGRGGAHGGAVQVLQGPVATKTFHICEITINNPCSWFNVNGCFIYPRTYFFFIVYFSLPAFLGGFITARPVTYMGLRKSPTQAATAAGLTPKRGLIIIFAAAAAAATGAAAAAAAAASRARILFSRPPPPLLPHLIQPPASKIRV